MPTKSLFAGLLLLAASGGAAQAQAIDSEFFIGVLKDGVEEYAYTTELPLIPGEICYYWRLQLDDKTGAVAYTEVFRLPDVPTTMGDVEGQIDPSMKVEEDGKLVTVTRNGDLDDGWFGNGWCVSDGDPLGPHNITIKMQGKTVGSFDFTVVDPDGYVMPELQATIGGEEAPVDETVPTEAEPEPEVTPEEEPDPQTEEQPESTTEGDESEPTDLGGGKDKETQR